MLNALFKCHFTSFQILPKPFQTNRSYTNAWQLRPTEAVQKEASSNSNLYILYFNYIHLMSKQFFLICYRNNLMNSLIGNAPICSIRLIRSN